MRYNLRLQVTKTETGHAWPKESKEKGQHSAPKRKKLQLTTDPSAVEGAPRQRWLRVGGILNGGPIITPTMQSTRPTQPINKGSNQISTTAETDHGTAGRNQKQSKVNTLAAASH
jgi:hypothetical protein